MTTNTLVGLLLNWRARIAFAPEGQGGAGGDGQDGGDNGASPGATGDGEPPAGDGTGAGGDATGESGGDPSTWQYDVAFFESYGLDEGGLASYTEGLRAAGISPDQARALAELDAGFIQQQQEADAAYIAELQKQLEGDRYLSENWDLTTQRVGAALKAVDAPQDVLDKIDTDAKLQAVFGQPFIMKAMAMLGQFLSNDKFEKGTASGEQVDAAASWYGATTPNQKRS